ncbi:MAG: hypothetical protein ACRC6M_15165 [Microcystaceae cyanobacterium]
MTSSFTGIDLVSVVFSYFIFPVLAIATQFIRLLILVHRGQA